MNQIDTLRSSFLEYLEEKINNKQPAGLYEPVHYILKLGGKRLRPVLTLMSAAIYDAPIKNALDAAVAVEVFHNFTLLHDDIMDAAELRRGEKTVHKKWDINTGILSGDAMLILAYQQLDSYEGATYKELVSLFSRTALEVCEGQQHDVDFETRDDVSIEEYLKMITLKTSVLVGCALQMGAIIAGADLKQQELIYNYGLNLGIAFQLMDDYLDAYGDPETFGKEVGGDIRENKKTYLYLKSIEDEGCATELKEWFAIDQSKLHEKAMEEKKETVTVLFDASGGAQATLDAIKEYTQKALTTITELSVSEAHKKELTAFSLELMGRVS